MAFPDVGPLDPPLCPFLGRVDDERTSFTFPHYQHRCYAVRRRRGVDYSYQAAFCLGAYADCPRYRKAVADPKHADRLRAAADAVRARRAPGPDASPEFDAATDVDGPSAPSGSTEGAAWAADPAAVEAALAAVAGAPGARAPSLSLPPPALFDPGALMGRAPGGGEPWRDSPPVDGIAGAGVGGSVATGAPMADAPTAGVEAGRVADEFGAPPIALAHATRSTRAPVVLVRIAVLALITIMLAIAVALLSTNSGGGRGVGSRSEHPAGGVVAVADRSAAAQAFRAAAGRPVVVLGPARTVAARPADGSATRPGWSGLPA